MGKDREVRTMHLFYFLAALIFLGWVVFEYLI